MPIGQNEEIYRSYAAVAKNIPLWRVAKNTKYRQMMSSVLNLEQKFSKLSDEELRQLSRSYHTEVVNGKSLDDVLVPVFAITREVAFRLLNMKHFPMQILGGIALHNCHIVEMSTGEGKTLVATLPSALNAMSERGVHVVTVNDYLAKRDAEWMGKIYQFMGLTVGCITHDKPPAERVIAYRSHITYGTNKEFGFDYLRDQIRNRVDSWYEFGKPLNALRVQKVQRPDFFFSVVDEADSVLIDEARTPLIIANTPPVDEEVAEEYYVADQVAMQLVEDIDYEYDRPEKRIEFLKAGEQRVTKLLGGRRSRTGHRIDWHEACLRGLKAHLLFHRDVEYVIEKDEVIIVDENVGRKMPGRHWEDGLHQAVAAKEKLSILGETESLARTTYQLYFNRYEKLAGMTGTALTDAVEFASIYRRGTLRIPTNRTCIRKIAPDTIYATEAEKWDAVIKEVIQVLGEKRSILVGTRSIDKSDLISAKLKEIGIDHIVLNALFEDKEAAIVAEAGKPGRVTVATNMAGRGTDIVLDPLVAAAGGLHVIGTERHESRRIDNQLIGRCARQGDPGSAHFIVSLEDPLILRYKAKQAEKLIKRYGGTGKPINNPWVKFFFNRVQRNIESQHRKIRYELIKYDRERKKYNRQIGTE